MLKVFFKKGSSGAYRDGARVAGGARSVRAESDVRCVAAPLPARGELAVTAELERELSADAPLHRRLRALKDLSEKALVIRIQEVHQASSLTLLSYPHYTLSDVTRWTISLT